MLIILAVLAVVSSFIAGVIPPSETGELADPGEWLDIVVEYLKIVYSLLPFIALSVFLTVLTSSTAVGIAVSIGYYLLVASVNTWNAAPLVEVEVNSVSGEQSSDALQAFIVILVYTAVLLGVSFWLFMRRDIAGARGD